MASVTFGPLYPATCTSDSSIGTIPWLNPSNAGASDSTYTTAAVTSIASSNYLKVVGFGFSIPSDSVIVGIVCEIAKFQSGSAFSGPKDQHLYTVKAGTIQTSGSDKAVTGTFWPASIATTTYGSSSDLWGGSWTPADINDSGFGFALSINSNASRTADVDFIRGTIYTTTGIYTAVGMFIAM